ncbi:uncharacterized protein BX664DRAFT_382494 [Halteromyces radiatus]|uniref:uncharacterized protein n=1 Tax=Halteromyces radiatus TaxID=101107 RepID=UPI00221E8A90|nr:uncharacterized protein BX664DRAFT_382494 [Halteromyces radiatus]KAI8100053.1 hypothetical protein BX664DRAFT_382494 [Halteromyces radiatus]
MGYCNRCGDIINGTKCRKCGGKPVESLAKGTNDPKASVVDRWQNQYASSILSGPEPMISSSTPLNKRYSMASYASSYRTRTPSLSVQPKTCILCHKAVPLGTQLGKGDYCYECRTKIFDKSSSSSSSSPNTDTTQTQCVVCSQPINPNLPNIHHQGRTWHPDCVRCHTCLKPLPDPTALDLQGNSRCLSCQQNQQSMTSPTSTVGSSIGSASRFSPITRSTRNESFGSATTISTYGDNDDNTFSLKKKSVDGISALPRLESQLFRHYQKSVSQQQHSDSSVPKTTSPSPIVRPLSSQSSSPSLSSSYMPSKLSTSSSTDQKGQQQQQQLRQRRSSLAGDKPSSKKKTCRKCTQGFNGFSRIRLPTPTGNIWYYHYNCLTCAACDGHFDQPDYVCDGKDVFHLHCRAPSPPQSVSPLSPLSPTTSSGSTTDIISPSSSPIPSATKSSSNLQTRQRRLSSTPLLPTEYQCHTCHLPIEDKCLKNGTRFFHPKCFICFSCHENLPSDKPFYDIQQEAHCEECTRQIIKTGSRSNIYNNKTEKTNNNRPTCTTSSSASSSIRSSISPLSPSMSSPLFADNNEKAETPSHIWMHRTRALPKLGGSKICAGCHKSIAVMEDTPGPKASRWHKKCLKCTGCKKQLDSSVKKLTVVNDKWLVHCSDCSDKNPRPHYVR